MWFVLKSEGRLSLSPGNGLFELKDYHLAALPTADTVLLATQLRRYLPILHKQLYGSVGLLKDPSRQLLNRTLLRNLLFFSPSPLETAVSK